MFSKHILRTAKKHRRSESLIKSFSQGFLPFFFRFELSFSNAELCFFSFVSFGGVFLVGDLFHMITGQTRRGVELRTMRLKMEKRKNALCSGPLQKQKNSSPNAVSGQRYPCPARVICDLNSGGAGQRSQRGRSPE